VGKADKRVFDLGDEIEGLLESMQAFEAARSIPRTGTGSRREGGDFEALVARVWESLICLAEELGASKSIVRGGGSRKFAKLCAGQRCLYVPISAGDAPSQSAEYATDWLATKFAVGELVAAYPTERTAIERYAPEVGPFAGARYPAIYQGLGTAFDDTVVLEESGVLREKILLEYKTAKASGGTHVDGNAHERLSFQIMQYLEVATRYPACSLVVIANGAFVRYRNKYHTSFHVQADRLGCFAWFSMQHACTVPEYRLFFGELMGWLLLDRPRTRNR